MFKPDHQALCLANMATEQINVCARVEPCTVSIKTVGGNPIFGHNHKNQD